MRTWIIVSILGMFLFLIPGFNHGLWTPDEPRVAGTCAEIARTHDFIVPTLNGKPFLEKPPLYYALGGISGFVFGADKDISYRLVSLMFAILTILVVVMMITPTQGLTMGILAGFILASSWEFFMLSRWIQVDIALVFGVTLAMFAYQRWLDTSGISYSILLGLATGIAFMSKGLVGPAIIAAAIIMDMIRQRDFSITCRISPFGVIAFMLIPIIPWILALWNRGGWPFFRVAFVVNNLMRFTGAAEGAALGHQNGPLYYFHIFPGSIIPWTLLFIPALISSIRNFRNDRYISWFLAPFIILSIASTKRGIYLAPLIPAMACMIVSWLQKDSRMRWEDVLVKITWIVSFVGCLTPFAGIYLGIPFWGAGMGLLGVCSLLFILWSKKQNAALSLGIITFIAVIANTTIYYQFWKPEKDYLEFAHQAIQVSGTRTIYMYQPRELLRGLISVSTGKINSEITSPLEIKSPGIFIWEDRKDEKLNALKQQTKVDLLAEKVMDHKKGKKIRLARITPNT